MDKTETVAKLKELHALEVKRVRELTHERGEYQQMLSSDRTRIVELEAKVRDLEMIRDYLVAEYNARSAQFEVTTEFLRGRGFHID